MKSFIQKWQELNLSLGRTIGLGLTFGFLAVILSRFGFDEDIKELFDNLSDAKIHEYLYKGYAIFILLALIFNYYKWIRTPQNITEQITKVLIQYNVILFSFLLPSFIAAFFLYFNGQIEYLFVWIILGLGLLAFVGGIYWLVISLTLAEDIEAVVDGWKMLRIKMKIVIIGLTTIFMILMYIRDYLINLLQ